MIRKYLPVTMGTSGYTESGQSALLPTRNVSASVSWRHDAPSLRYSVVATIGKAHDVPVWQPAGDTATASASYSPVSVDREFSGVAVSGEWKPRRWLELEGSYQHVSELGWSDGGAPAASPQDSWMGIVRVPLHHRPYQLVVVPQVAVFGARGGTSPSDWINLVIGVEATLKHFTFFWHRENVLNELYRTGGAYPTYETHSRFGFRWNFWN